MTFDFRSMMESVARQLLGEPNWRLSKPPKELRFGTHGSMSCIFSKSAMIPPPPKAGTSIIVGGR